MFYDKPMIRHIEMHLIENAGDQRLADSIGLETSDNEVCSNCYEPVGESFSGNTFTPFLLILDEENEWITCASCASPVL
jgi:hypothetical protein